MFDKLEAKAMVASAETSQVMSAKVNKVAPIATGVMFGMMGVSTLAYADAAAEIADKLNATLETVFKALQSIGGPLVGVALVFCLLAIVFCVFTGNSKGISIWKTAAIVAVVSLILIYAVPTIVQWAGSFGKEVAGSTTSIKITT